MGTRGVFGVIVNEQEKIGYNQFDSYPEGKGIKNLRWLREVVTQGRVAEVRLKAKNARLVDGSVTPTPEDISRLSSVTDLNVSLQSTTDWYCLTRATHGDIGAMLESGYIYDSHEFPEDSLFCEWAYMVDFDAEYFEVYKGFQSEPHRKGRFADRSPKPVDWKPQYPSEKYWYPVALEAEWSFQGLPSDEEFLLKTEVHEDNG